MAMAVAKPRRRRDHHVAWMGLRTCSFQQRDDDGYLYHSTLT